MFALLAAVLGAAALTDGRAFMETIFSATDVYSRKEAVATQVAPLPAWPALRPLVGRTALVFALGAAALAVTAAWRAGRLAAVAVAATMLAVVPSVGQALALVSTARAVSGMAAEIRLGWQPDLLLVHEGPLENSGALELYSGELDQHIAGLDPTIARPQHALDMVCFHGYSLSWQHGSEHTYD